MTVAERSAFETINVFERWDREYYPPLAERYYDRAVAEMLRLLHVQPGEAVLDAGCGPGVHSVRVARAGHTVRAIDISTAALAEARRRSAAADVAGRITFEEADLTRLAYDDASFSRIFSWGVVIHIRDIESALRELVRVLKPGGRLALYVTNHRAVDYPLLRLARRLRRRPPFAQTRSELGIGSEFDSDGERLWVWQVDVAGVTRFLNTCGLRRVARLPGSLSELQRRCRGRLRDLLLRANNAWFRLHLPARPCVTNLLVFEKSQR